MCGYLAWKPNILIIFWRRGAKQRRAARIHLRQPCQAATQRRLVAWDVGHDWMLTSASVMALASFGLVLVADKIRLLGFTTLHDTRRLSYLVADR